MRTVHTNDENERQSFKARQAQRIEELNAPILASKPVERVYLLPSDYEELSEAGLIYALTRNPELHYDPAAAQFVVSILNGSEPKPNYVKFEITSEPGYRISTKPASTKERIPEETHIMRTEDTEKRLIFKNVMAERVQFAKVEEPEIVPANKNRNKISVPANFSELGESFIHQSLTLRGLTQDQSREVCGFLFAGQPTSFELMITGRQDPGPSELVADRPESKTFDIEAPHDFLHFKVKDQLQWLTKEHGLSFSEAGDVIDLINNRVVNSINQYNVSLCQYELPAVTYVPSPKKKKQQMQKKTKTQYSIETEVPVEELNVKLPENFSSLQAYERHFVLVNKFQLFPDEAAEILTEYRKTGKTEFTISRHAVAVQKLEQAKADIDAVIAHEKMLMAEEGSHAMALDLPYGFASLIPKDQADYLKAILHMPAEQANDVVAALNLGKSKANYEFTYGLPTEPQANPTEGFVNRRNETRAKLAVDYSGYELASDSPSRSVHVDIPQAFSTLAESERQRFLVTTFRLFPGEAAAIIASLRDNPETTEFLIERPEKQVKAKPEPVQLTVDIILPENFASNNQFRQFAYLKSVSKLPPDQANDVMAVIQGKPQKSNTIFNISYQEATAPTGDPVKEFIAQRVLKAEADSIRLAADKRAFELAHKPAPVRAPVAEVPVRTMEVTVPKTVLSVDPSQQYLYFTRVNKMLPDEATQLVASLSGHKTPIVFTVNIEE